MTASPPQPAPPNGDLQLVERTVVGDQRAFELLVLKYQRRIERAIRAQKRRMWTATPDKEQDEKSRLRALQSEYRRFSSAVNLRTEEERLYARGVPRIKKKK